MSRKLVIALGALVLLLVAACGNRAGRHIVIEYPHADSACEGLTITRVELTDSATRVEFHLACAEDCWVILEPSAHLTSRGISYPMTGHDGLKPDSKVPMKGENRERTFTLTFSPLPEGTTEFNFLEGRAAGCWQVLGVKLDPAMARNYASN